MPLLNRQPFFKIKPPPDLRPDEEVFFCEPTKEVFRDYDKFFERMILCNSLLWSCEMTGKSGLTFSEAADSERTARKSLSTIPKELKRALLFICSLMKKTNFIELYNDIFVYVKERYFKGETVLLRKGSQWVECVIQTIVITAADPEQDSVVNGLTNQTGASPQKRPAAKPPSEGIPAARVIYQVLQPSTGRLSAVRHTDLRRDKGGFSRERLRVLLKHSTRVDEAGFIVLRAPAVRGLGLEQMKFGDVFVGAPPRFGVNKAVQRKSPAAVTAAGVAKVEKVEKPRPVAEKKPEPARNKPKTEMVFDENDDEPLSSVQTEIRERWEAERRRLVELRVQERDRRRHRKKLVAEWLRDWARPREDLLCEDHQELPIMHPVQTRVPLQLFGGCLQLVEFVSGFGALMDVADTFPLGVTLPVLERALCEPEVAGALSDLLQMLLRALFELQKEEDEESGGHSAASAPSAAGHMDPLTLTEVLRQHLVARDTVDDSRWRYGQRGGYTETDNPTCQFRLDHPDIMDKLTTETVYDLSPGERLAVLECLAGEILTTVTARDMIDDADSKLREARQQLRVVRINTQAFQRGIQAEKVTERREAQQRQQQEQQKTTGDTSADPPPTDGDPPDPSAPSAPSPAAPEPLSEAERARRRRDQERQLSEFGRKEARLQEQIAELSRTYALTPLGRDRAYRRYWAGRAIPGLYVEHDDDTVGGCLPSATPHNRQLSEAGGDQQAVLRRLLTDRLLGRAGQQGGSAGPAAAGGSPSDKENTPAPPQPKTYTKKPATLTEQNQPGTNQAGTPSDLVAKTRLDDLVSGDLVSGELDLAAELRAVPTPDSRPPDRRLLVCTGDQDECPVHSAILPRTAWSFCPDLEHLDQLMATLNERGHREAELKAAIQQAGDSLRRSVERTRHSELTPGADGRPRRDPTANGGRDPNYNFPAGTPVAEILELLMRDMILECEEKIRFGCLGTVQVRDLLAWRQALVERSYDQQCEKLSWGANGACSVDNSVDASRASTPTSVTDEPAAAELSARLQRRHLVVSLASAVLQLEQGIDRRFLQTPLAESEKALLAWERSLMASTSLSQLFVHFAQLESSVQWSRSALNARCKLCRKRSDPEKMLLCDGCDKGFHMFCLTPKIRSIPKGDWFCSTCRPKEKPKSPKKKRRCFVLAEPESEAEEEEAQEEAEEEEEEEVEEFAVVEEPEPPAKNGKKRRSEAEPSGGAKRSGGSSKKTTPTARRTREPSPQTNGSSAAKKRRSAPEATPSASEIFNKAAHRRLLDELKTQPTAEYFLKPVKEKDAPGYYQIVREPMDLMTISKKLRAGEYSSNAEFTADAGLIFSNCLMYNDSKAQISKDCLKLRKFFEKRSKEMGLTSAAPAAKKARRSH